jgi:hypothetical protein
MHIYPPVPAVLLAAALFLTGARAEALEFVFSDDFERLPPASEKLSWFLEQLVPGEPITDAEILENFAPGWFSGFTVQQTRDFLLSVRASYPSGEVTDQISLTPMQFVGMVTGTNGNEAFVIVESKFAEPGITQLFVSFFGTGQGTVVRAEHQNLNLSQAADEFLTMSSQPALLIARINASNQCVVVEGRNEDAARATASIFKIWVLGGLAEAVESGAVAIQQMVARTDAEEAPGGPVANEPNNTPFSVLELAELMLGMSDNTATDLLHELVGREALNPVPAAFGHAQPELLTPFLNISETFHLLFSVPFAEANAYLNDREAGQAAFVTDTLEPLGSFAANGGGFNNAELTTTVTWRASPLDICNAFARHGTWAIGSDESLLVEIALGAGAAQPRLRNQWDRVWYKGGNLIVEADPGNPGFEQVVLTHAWLLENEGSDPYVVVVLSNGPTDDIDTFDVQSITGRILELLASL